MPPHCDTEQTIRGTRPPIHCNNRPSLCPHPPPPIYVARKNHQPRTWSICFTLTSWAEAYKELMREATEPHSRVLSL